MHLSGYFDLHCDTLTAIPEGMSPCRCNSLDRSGNALRLSAPPDALPWAQLFAVFLPDSLCGAAAIEYFQAHCANFHRQMECFSDRVRFCRSYADMERAWQEGRCAALLTVENGSALAGDAGRIAVLHECGVRVLTLVWNGKNELGSGNDSPCGLTDFGRQVLPLLEQSGILLDVSHLNDQGLAEVLELAQKPFLATHSNARSVTPHPRNLSDFAIRELVQRDCLIGLNFHAPFLGISPEQCAYPALYRQIQHFCALGASAHLALGSDFDGATLPLGLRSPRQALRCADWLVAQGLSPALVDAIFFGNARRFFQRNLP